MGNRNSPGGRRGARSGRRNSPGGKATHDRTGIPQPLSKDLKLAELQKEKYRANTFTDYLKRHGYER